MKIQVLAKSSSGTPYTVFLLFKNGKLFASCSCKAGIYDMLCKHKIALAAGDASMLFDKKEQNKLTAIQKLIENTELSSIISEYHKTKLAIIDGEQKLKTLKSKLSKILKPLRG